MLQEIQYTKNKKYKTALLHAVPLLYVSD